MKLGNRCRKQRNKIQRLSPYFRHHFLIRFVDIISFLSLFSLMQVRLTFHPCLPMLGNAVLPLHSKIKYGESSSGAFLPSTSDGFLAIWTPLLRLKIWVIIVGCVVVAVFESTGLESNWSFLPVGNSFPFVLAWAKT